MLEFGCKNAMVGKNGLTKDGEITAIMRMCVFYFREIFLSFDMLKKSYCQRFLSGGVCESLSRTVPRPNLKQDFIRNVDCFGIKEC